MLLELNELWLRQRHLNDKDASQIRNTGLSLPHSKTGALIQPTAAKLHSTMFQDMCIKVNGRTAYLYINLILKLNISCAQTLAPLASPSLT